MDLAGGSFVEHGLLSRDKTQDDSLGLHCVWYADILMVLTRPDIHVTTSISPGASRHAKIDWILEGIAIPRAKPRLNPP